MNMSLHQRLATASLGATLLCLIPITASASAIEPTAATASLATQPLRLAQSGSMGGTIGNQEKSLSGSRDADAERPAQPRKPKQSARETPARRGGGGDNFDGVWTVVSRGCSGAGTGSVTVIGGRIVTQGASGSISSNGTIRAVTSLGNAGISISTGRANGRTASGSYRQSDGCTGRFTAVRN